MKYTQSMGSGEILLFNDMVHLTYGLCGRHVRQLMPKPEEHAEMGHPSNFFF